jgi:hypothetical protein
MTEGCAWWDAKKEDLEYRINLFEQYKYLQSVGHNDNLIASAFPAQMKGFFLSNETNKNNSSILTTMCRMTKR